MGLRTVMYGHTGCMDVQPPLEGSRVRVEREAHTVHVPSLNFFLIPHFGLKASEWRLAVIPLWGRNVLLPPRLSSFSHP
jgi:hypothetical protein